MVETHDSDDPRQLYGKRLFLEVSSDELGDDFKGYDFKIMEGRKKQVLLTEGRVQLFVHREAVNTQRRVFKFDGLQRSSDPGVGSGGSGSGGSSGAG